jgi:AraC-like DNA-binding protein
MKKALTSYRYIPISDLGRKWGCYVLDGGYTLVPAGSAYPICKHPDDYHFTWEQGRTLHSFAMIYITRGQGRFESKITGELSVKSGDLFVLHPEIWHRYQPDPETGWDEYWIEFDGDYARQLMRHEAFSKEHPVLHPGYAQPLVKLFMEVVETLRQEPAEYELLLGALAGQIIAQTLSALKRASYAGQPVEEVIRQAKELLSHQAGKHHRLEEFADQLNLSYTSFRRLFKAQTGFSPRQFAIQVGVNRAKELLARNDTPVTQIAAELGFEAADYFSKHFRQKTGMSPTEYRSRARLRQCR